MVDVWYPAKTAPAHPPAPYLPDMPAVAQLLGEAGLRKELDAAYTQMVKGRLYTHAEENAPFAPGLKRCPVLIFSHGFDVLKTSYTALLEDLTSHGFVIAAIAHTYDTPLVAFPDGHVIRFEQEQWTANSGSEQAEIHYENVRMKVWASDIRFVIDQLTRYDRESDFGAPFVDHLDLSSIGALGHSAGGRAAALGCQTDDRVRACLDMDGVTDNLPFSRDVQGNTMNQPFMLFLHMTKTPNPTDQELAKMGYSREQLKALIESVEKKQTDLLAGMSAGSYRVTLATAGNSHMSFSDLPLLDAADDAAEYANSLITLKVVRTCTLSFFDEALRGKKSTLLNRKSRSEPLMTVEWFPPTPKSPKRSSR